MIMNTAKVIEISNDTIYFDNGTILTSNHDQDCCESHELDMEHLTLKDFEGLEFDLNNDNFFRRIEDYGIELVPVKGWPVKIPGYGSNNGYYSTELTLVVTNNKDFRKEYDISECQEIND